MNKQICILENKYDKLKEKNKKYYLLVQNYILYGSKIFKNINKTEISITFNNKIQTKIIVKLQKKLKSLTDKIINLEEKYKSLEKNNIETIVYANNHIDITLDDDILDD